MHHIILKIYKNCQQQKQSKVNDITNSTISNTLFAYATSIASEDNLHRASIKWWSATSSRNLLKQISCKYIY